MQVGAGCDAIGTCMRSRVHALQQWLCTGVLSTHPPPEHPWPPSPPHHCAFTLAGLRQAGRHSFSNTDFVSGAWQGLSQLGSAISHSTLVQSIKRAASQPALASSHLTSFGDAADAVLRGPSSTGGGASEAVSRAQPAAAPRKEGPKKD